MASASDRAEEYLEKLLRIFKESYRNIRKTPILIVLYSRRESCYPQLTLIQLTLYPPKTPHNL